MIEKTKVRELEVLSRQEWKSMVARMVELEDSGLPEGVSCDWERVFDFSPDKNPGVSKAFKENFREEQGVRRG